MERGYLVSASLGGKKMGAIIVGDPHPLSAGEKA